MRASSEASERRGSDVPASGEQIKKERRSDASGKQRKSVGALAGVFLGLSASSAAAAVRLCRGLSAPFVGALIAAFGG